MLPLYLGHGSPDVVVLSPPLISLIGPSLCAFGTLFDGFRDSDGDLIGW
jgi:hypothetical protein